MWCVASLTPLHKVVYQHVVPGVPASAASKQHTVALMTMFASSRNLLQYLYTRCLTISLIELRASTHIYMCCPDRCYGWNMRGQAYPCYPDRYYGWNIRGQTYPCYPDWYYRWCTRGQEHGRLYYINVCFYLCISIYV